MALRLAPILLAAALLFAVQPSWAYGSQGAAADLGPFSGTPAEAHRAAAGWLLAAPLPTPPAGYGSYDLFDAAATLMERHGGVQPGVLAQLASVAPPIRQDLTRVITAFLVFEDAATRLAEEDAMADVLGARQALFETVLALEARLAYLPATAVVIDASPAFTLDLARADSTYTRDAALQIDAGGNDVYTNRAGGGVGDAGAFQFCDWGEDPSLLPAALVADFRGNDRYVSGKRCGVNGGGLAGAGFLYDARGDDVYRSGQGGVNGGAFLGGAGFLYDGGGHDVYDAQIAHETYAYGANGAGSLGGVGLLVDVAGSDHYSAGQEGANGGGYGGGVGLLIDGSGDDEYHATALGVNGAGYSGRGMLWDGAGDDAYVAWGCCGGTHEPMDNGGGTLGIGCLYDGDGRDRYQQRGVDAWDQTVEPKGDRGAQVDDVGRARDGC